MLNLLNFITLNSTLIGLSSVKTDLISWIAARSLLKIFCETKLGLRTKFL